jgi:hypothetical protein
MCQWTACTHSNGTQHRNQTTRRAFSIREFGKGVTAVVLVVNPLQAIVHLQTQKTILHGLSIPNHNISEFAFLLLNRSAD